MTSFYHPPTVTATLWSARGAVWVVRFAVWALHAVKSSKLSKLREDFRVLLLTPSNNNNMPTHQPLLISLCTTPVCDVTSINTTAGVPFNISLLKFPPFFIHFFALFFHHKYLCTLSLFTACNVKNRCTLHMFWRHRVVRMVEICSRFHTETAMNTRSRSHSSSTGDTAVSTSSKPMTSAQQQQIDRRSSRHVSPSYEKRPEL